MVLPLRAVQIMQLITGLQEPTNYAKWQKHAIKVAAHSSSANAAAYTTDGGTVSALTVRSEHLNQRNSVGVAA